MLGGARSAAEEEFLGIEEGPCEVFHGWAAGGRVGEEREEAVAFGRGGRAAEEAPEEVVEDGVGGGVVVEEPGEVVVLVAEEAVDERAAG